MAMATGSSIGVLSYAGRSPAAAYNADGFVEMPDSEDYRMTAWQANRIRAELEAGERRQQESRQASSSSARSDLSDATSQSLPAGIPIHSMATDEEEDMPPLETPTQVAEEEEEEGEDYDDETQVPSHSRKHKGAIGYNDKISSWKQSDVSVDGLLLQVHLRGIQLTEE